MLFKAQEADIVCRVGELFKKYPDDLTQFVSEPIEYENLLYENMKSIDIMRDMWIYNYDHK